MNFISHFYLERGRKESLFFIGVSTPDLVSVFDRSVRIKAHLLPPAEAGLSPAQQHFREGVMRHLIADQHFHSSPFFAQEVARLSEQFRACLPPGTVARSFFVAHVLFELMLDRVLLQADERLASEFYRHLEAHPPSELVGLTEWLTQTPMPAYGGFLQKFVRRKSLYGYLRWQDLIYVLRRILGGVGIRDCAYLHSPSFLALLRAYEADLGSRYSQELSTLAEALRQA
jgi:hypothetical protein